MMAETLSVYRQRFEDDLAKTDGPWRARAFRWMTRWALSRCSSEQREDIAELAAATLYALEAREAAPARPHWDTWAPGRFVGTLIKRPFFCNGHAELMWVEIVGVTVDGYLAGRLRNEPACLPYLHYDSPVTVAPSDVLDLVPVSQAQA